MGKVTFSSEQKKIKKNVKYSRRIYKYKIYKFFGCDLWGHLFFKNVRHRVVRCIYFSYGMIPVLSPKCRYQVFPLHFYVKKKLRLSFTTTNLFKIMANFKQILLRKKRKRSRVFSKFLLLKKLRMFYGNLRLYTFRKLLTYLNRGNIFSRENDFCLLLEGRLSILTFRLWFFRTIFEANVRIKKRYITVNGKIVIKPNYIVKDMDVISVVSNFKQKVREIIFLRLIFFRNLFGFPPYLEFSFRLCKAIFLKSRFKLKYIRFPFKLRMGYMQGRIF